MPVPCLAEVRAHALTPGEAHVGPGLRPGLSSSRGARWRAARNWSLVTRRGSTGESPLTPIEATELAHAHTTVAGFDDGRFWEKREKRFGEGTRGHVTRPSAHARRTVRTNERMRLTHGGRSSASVGTRRRTSLPLARFSGEAAGVVPARRAANASLVHRPLSAGSVARPCRVQTP